MDQVRAGTIAYVQGYLQALNDVEDDIHASGDLLELAKIISEAILTSEATLDVLTLAHEEGEKGVDV